MTRRMFMWVIYDHPKDFPEHFVARMHEIVPGNPRPTDTFIRSRYLGRIRTKMRAMNLYPIPRDPDDDPVIVETWV